MKNTTIVFIGVCAAIILGAIIYIITANHTAAPGAINSGTNQQTTSTEPTQPAVTTSTTGAARLNVGASGTVGDLTITFNSVISDNRCPIDVQCIVAGAVTANVTLSSQGKTVTRTMKSDDAPYTFGIHTVAIIKSEPAKMSKVTIQPKSYVLTFDVENASH